MRLGTVTLSTTLSALLLSGCSFIGGKPKPYENPYAKHKAAQYGQTAYGQNCQIATPRHPIPRGCRPEQVTIGVKPQAQNYGAPSYATNGFSQQPQFGQPQYTDGAYGSAVGQTPAVAHHTSGPKKRKPKLRGSFSIGAEKNFAGSVLDYEKRLAPDIDMLGVYDPQVFQSGFFSASDNGGTIETIYTANEQFADDIYNPYTYESDSRPNLSFADAWSTPLSVKGGLEYIVTDNTSVFVNGGYTYAEGNDDSTVTVDASLFKSEIEYDSLGNIIAGGVAYIPNETIATFNYDFSDLEQYDLEVGARHYLKPLVQSEGYRTVTPFVGASVGVSHVNATDITFGQRQVAYDTTFESLSEGGEADWFTVPADNPGANPLLGTTARIYDAQWLPTGQLNVGAEWQVTPGFALAAETGVRFKGARDYADFTNDAGETVSGRKGDVNIAVPLTLRGSVNF